MKKYIVTVGKEKEIVYEGETMWECLEYADEYYKEGYTIRTK